MGQFDFGMHRDDQVKNPLQGHTDSVESVALSSHRTHIVSGSYAKTIQCYIVNRGDSTKSSLHSGEMFKCKSTFVAPPFICFSSSTKHALHNSQNLFLDLPNVVEDCQDLVYLQDDGWIVGPNKKLLLWIPYSYHSSLYYTPWTRLVIPRGTLELDLSRMAHGSAWCKCYSPFQS